jgi:aryl-alcohol dehydrogenase-like predicted oxidoreductase
MNILNLPEKLHPLKSSLIELQNICKENTISIGSLALNFAIGNPLIDKVVIGVDSVLQLKENIAKVKLWKHDQQLIDRINKIEVTHKELLNPVNWK